jgi:hypothetical protein
VDESVRHLQDSLFQVSLSREGAVPVWVGMGWIATESGAQSKDTKPCLLHYLAASESCSTWCCLVVASCQCRDKGPVLNLQVLINSMRLIGIGHAFICVQRSYR